LGGRGSTPALLVCPAVYLAVMLRNELFAAPFASLPFVAVFAGIAPLGRSLAGRVRAARAARWECP